MKYLMWLWALICTPSRLWKEKQEWKRKQREEWKRFLREKAAEKKAIEDAFQRHLAQNPDWRSDEGKKAFIKELYGDNVPYYQWFAIGQGAEASPEEVDALVAFFWPEHKRSFGDWELHRSSYQEVGTTLRIRFAGRLATTITFGGKECPMSQVGYSNWGFSEGNGPSAHFVKLFKEAKTQAA